MYLSLGGLQPPGSDLTGNGLITFSSLKDPLTPAPLDTARPSGKETLRLFLLSVTHGRGSGRKGSLLREKLMGLDTMRTKSGNPQTLIADFRVFLHLVPAILATPPGLSEP